MPIINAKDNKKALLAYKEKILNDIKYYEGRINEDTSADVFITDNFDASSESEDDCPFTIDNGLMVKQLKLQKKMLQTGLHATQELASLTVLQYKVDVLVEDPVLNGEPPVLQPGSWREVNADCRIDLVPFSTTFYIHQTNELFGAKSYRALNVLPVKPAQEVELSKSVLMRVKTPSDATEVLRSYAIAYRSRRTTLARLADKYASNLFMEPMPTGGYILKCANLLEISWILENKWSNVAPFYHKMIFDLENMDECYIKIIRHAHKQLGDPSTDTTQRTLLLSKIIATCLEAHGTQELYESMESDTESVKKIEKRRLTLENKSTEPKRNKNENKNDEIDYGNTEDNITDNDNANNNDNQIMAPPKSLPKKGKPKGKENIEHNRKSVKRATVENEPSNAKKAKTDNIRQSEIEINKVEQSKQNKGNKDNAKNKEKVAKSLSKSEKVAKITENDTEHDNNPSESNTENIYSKENEAKSQNTKDEAVIQNNEKESVKNVPKSKVVKSKNKEDRPKGKEKNNVQEENANDKPIQDKQIINVQEKAQKKVAKDKNSQKIASGDKISKHDPTKNLESENVASKLKNINTSLKNDPKSTDPNQLKEPSKEKKAISSKNDLKMTENNAKQITNNFKPVEIDDIPIFSVNNINVDKIPRKDKISDKTVKNLKGASKSANINKKAPIKNAKIDNKLLNNAESTNTNKKLGNKETHNTNVKKSNLSKDTKFNTKSSADNTVSKNDNHLQKNSSNKAEVQNTKNGSNIVKISEQPKTSKEIKSSAKQKGTDKNTGQTKEKVSTNIANNAENKGAVSIKKSAINNPKITVNNNKKSNEVTKEKNDKFVNDAIKIKNIANIKKTNTKIGDGKPKMAIKTLMHKTRDVSNKMPKSLNISGKNKNVKSGNIINNMKAGNENDSRTKISKIPMKLSSIHESLKKKNPLRISPRKLPSTFKCSSESNISKKSYFTNIPRLLKKPEPKNSK